MSKRTISDVVDADTSSPSSSQPPSKRRRASPPPHERVLPYLTPDSSIPTKPTTFQRPLPLLTFSYTPERVLEFTDSALRYFVEPPPNADLNYGYDRWIQRPEERGRLDGLLKGWLKASEGKGRVEGVGAVLWRGVMTKILTSVYEETDSLELNVMKVKGIMYLEEHLSDAALRDKGNMPPHRRLQSYYGYAFESYCTQSLSPQQTERKVVGTGWGGDVDTNVQWCCVAKTKLGNTRVILGGEVDCVKERFDGTSDAFVELKTSMLIRTQNDEARFERKMLKFYFQSFLLGVPKIIVGFRTPKGRVTTTQSFKTLEIPRLVRGKEKAWDPLLCLAWADQFLAFLMNAVSGPDHGASCVWRVKFIPREGVRVRVLSENEVKEVEGGEERIGFLPRWYWDELERSSGSPNGEG